MVVCNDEGFYLYAGKEMKQKGFYAQKGVIDVKFSPDERYAVSYNGDETNAKSK